MQQYNSIFFVGIKGVAMANLARIFHQMGKKVAGSDTDEVFITDKELTDIAVIHSFEAKDLPENVDVVVYSAAHGGENNPQVQEAKKRGLSVMHQAQFIGKFLKDFPTSIAVAGCHGKTTTSALLAYALQTLGQKPSYMVGVSEFNEMYGGQFGDPKYFVVEADEYGMDPPKDKTPKFLSIHPDYALITNIDFDHPDVYKDLAETKEVFLRFIQNIKDPAKQALVICGDDPHALALAHKLPHEYYLTYGFAEDSDIQITNVQATEVGMTFSVKSVNLGIADDFSISLFGEKNVLNATGVIAMLRLLDFSLSQIQTAIEGFTGAKRRFELLHEIGDTYIFDDYAHHPHEIEATIQAARSRFPNKRVIVLFQPHTFTRTQSLKNEFVEALAKADKSLLLPIFGSARETDGADSISSSDLVKLAKEKHIENIYTFESKESLLIGLKHMMSKGDVIFTMGAGDIYKMAESIKSII